MGILQQVIDLAQNDPDSHGSGYRLQLCSAEKSKRSHDDPMDHKAVTLGHPNKVARRVLSRYVGFRVTGQVSRVARSTLSQLRLRRDFVWIGKPWSKLWTPNSRRPMCVSTYVRDDLFEMIGPQRINWFHAATLNFADNPADHEAVTLVIKMWKEFGRWIDASSTPGTICRKPSVVNWQRIQSSWTLPLRIRSAGPGHARGQ